MHLMFEKISVNPDVCHGQPCIKGTRIMVWLILAYLANGDSIEDILQAYPQLPLHNLPIRIPWQWRL